MKPNGFYFLAGLLVAAAIGLGVWLFQERERDSVEISVGGNSLRIERR